jgi:RNA polymerase sigma-70 factor (ECF subfamily)
MRERSDEDLMMQWAAGKMEAFELLYSRYRVPLYRYVLRLAGDDTTANDLYQGSWEKIIRGRK